MKHYLPTLERYLNKSFYFTENVSGFIDKEGENLPLFYKNMDGQISCLDSYTLLTLLKYKVPINEMPWDVVGILEQLDDWNIIHKKSYGVSRLLFIEKNQPIGYINTNDLLTVAITTYDYLKAYYDTILETMEESVSVIDEDKNTVVWTRGAEKIFSIKKENIIGLPMTKFFPKNMLETYNTMETGESVFRKQHQPREDLFVLINTKPIIINNKIVGAVAVETDMTSQVQLNEQLTNANHTIHHLRHEVSRMHPDFDPFFAIKGTSQAIKKAVDQAKQIGTTQARVLILGESGVGKELFAKAIHDMREQRNAPFIPVNCGAIPQALFESELFGYEKGAFSGADSKGHKGKIEMAQGGTLFLDEVAELPKEVQVKLLRFLQESTYYRVGGTAQKNANCRVIAATNKDLNQLVKEGNFRIDLYYRLNIVSLNIPPLRERKSDIVELSQLFLHEYGIKYSRPIDTISKDMMAELLNYHWPGNIRELSNIIERLVVFSKNGRLNKEDLPYTKSKEETLNDDKIKEWEYPSIDYSLKSFVEDKEKAMIKQAIEKAGGNKNKAAKLLGISRATLYNKILKLGI